MQPSIKAVPVRGTEPNPLMTTKEAAAFLNVSMQTVRKLAQRGDIPAVHIGHRVYIHRGKLLARAEMAASANCRALMQ
jgi:excisionase family DNA binding protein